MVKCFQYHFKSSKLHYSLNISLQLDICFLCFIWIKSYLNFNLIEISFFISLTVMIIPLRWLRFLKIEWSFCKNLSPSLTRMIRSRFLLKVDLRRRIFKYHQCILGISLLSPIGKKAWSFNWRNLNSVYLYLWMRCANFGWNCILE